MGRLSRRHALAGAVISAGLVVASTAASAGTAAATPTPGAIPAASAVTLPVGSAAQSAAGAYWTPARMAAATAAGPASRSAPGASPGVSPAAQATPTEPPGVPNPVTGDGVPTVGALFYTTGTKAHFCTASVVNSPPLDLLLTAAHCVYGSSPATNIAYVPEYHASVTPYGIWPVSSVTVAAGWKQSHNPALDFAFLAVAAQAGTKKKIQQVTGGLHLAANTGYAHPVYVIGYNDTSGLPIGCATKSFEFKAGQMELYCNSFWDGTSGSPWIINIDHATGTGSVIGDIGGYEQGGDYAWASYSDYYSTALAQLYAEALR
jgi:V8-like Glu-specific endopeptidase